MPLAVPFAMIFAMFQALSIAGGIACTKPVPTRAAPDPAPSSRHRPQTLWLYLYSRSLTAADQNIIPPDLYLQRPMHETGPYYQAFRTLSKAHVSQTLAYFPG